MKASLYTRFLRQHLQDVRQETSVRLFIDYPAGFAVALLSAAAMVRLGELRLAISPRIVIGLGEGLGGLHVFHTARDLT